MWALLLTDEDDDDFLEYEEPGEKAKRGRTVRGWGKRNFKRVWSTFWGAHQRFFHQLCCAAKVQEASCV